MLLIFSSIRELQTVTVFDLEFIPSVTLGVNGIKIVTVVAQT